MKKYKKIKKSDLNLYNSIKNNVEKNNPGIKVNYKYNKNIAIASTAEPLTLPFSIALSAAIAAILNSLINTVRFCMDTKKSNKWNVEKFKETIETEMINKNIHEYKIYRVENFKKFLIEKHEDCIVRLFDINSKKKYLLRISKERDAYFFQLL